MFSDGQAFGERCHPDSERTGENYGFRNLLIHPCKAEHTGKIHYDNKNAA